MHTKYWIFFFFLWWVKRLLFFFSENVYFKQKLLLDLLKLFSSVSAVTLLSIWWQPLHRISGWFTDCFVVWGYLWNILYLIKDFRSRQIWGGAKYRCCIPKSKREQTVWDWISSVIANCRCACMMERWLKVFLYTWRGQYVMFKGNGITAISVSFASLLLPCYSVHWLGGLGCCQIIIFFLNSDQLHDTCSHFILWTVMWFKITSGKCMQEV